MEVVVASTVSRFTAFIRAYATEELDGYTTMQPLTVDNLFFLGSQAGGCLWWTYITQSLLEDHSEIINS
jgi:hypothetical protein